MKESLFNKWLLLSVLWLAAGAYALIWREGGSSAPPFPHFDKLAHAALFFAQFWLLSKVFLTARRSLPVPALLAAALLLAVGSEWAQAAFTVSRQAEVWDGAADMAGAGAALYLAWRLQAVRQARLLSAQK